MADNFSATVTEILACENPFIEKGIAYQPSILVSSVGEEVTATCSDFVSGGSGSRAELSVKLFAVVVSAMDAKFPRAKL